MWQGYLVDALRADTFDTIEIHEPLCGERFSWPISQVAGIMDHGEMTFSVVTLQLEGMNGMMSQYPCLLFPFSILF